MEKKQLFGILSFISFACILFSPTDSMMPYYFGILGAIFAFGWMKN